MASTTASRKSKGRIAQQDVVLALRQKYGFDLEQIKDAAGTWVDTKPSTDCYNGDVTCRTMGASGVDIVLSPEAKSIIPLDIEVKAQEGLNIWSAMKQCEANSGADRVPLLAFKRNRTEMYACLKLSDLLKLLKT